MKKIIYFIVLAWLMYPVILSGQTLPQITPAGKGIVNLKVDNVGYWRKMMALGYVKPQPYIKPGPAIHTSSIISADGVRTQDSPDIPVTTMTNTTQSENSIFIDPFNEDVTLNSNNSSDWDGIAVNTIFGADDFYSVDGGYTWGGSDAGAGNENNGDPATAISSDGRWYVGAINAEFGQSVAYSTDQGQVWHQVDVSSVFAGSDILDKNHLWVDNAPSSPYKNYVYDAWTNFVYGGPNNTQIEVSRSVNGGLSWSTPLAISFNAMAESANQGVNLHTGPNGELYAAWAIYDAFPGDENAIGFAKSTNGGAAFEGATRIISNIKGIRLSGTTKTIRVNSFPSMSVDISGGPHNGNIYVVWANRGVPGINTGNDIDVFLIRSSDEGNTWSAPVRVNQDPPGNAKEHFFPWITCDPETGYLCVIYYDDRNTDTTKCETWVSYSYDAGNSWTDMKVSDVSFTPTPIPGLAINYMGDYLGITSKNRKIYPVWTDNRTGQTMTYVSPFDLSPAPNQPWFVYYSDAFSLISNGAPENLNYGDSLYLSLGIQNIGDQPDSNLMVYISTPSPYITFTDSTESYGHMNPSEIKVIPHGFALKVSDTIPDNLLIRFNVRVTDGDTNWFSHFNVVSRAPSLKIKRLTIVDTTGNNNGRLDPGETVHLVYKLTNTGDFPCPNVVAVFSTTSDLITLNSGNTVALGTLLPGQDTVAKYSITVSDDAGVGSVAVLTLIATSGQYQVKMKRNEGIGLIVEDWESNTMSKFSWQPGGNNNWLPLDQDPYEGDYCAKSGVIVDNQKSDIYLGYATGIDDSISFYRKTSSEPGFDFLWFYIDGVNQGGWSGEQPWERVAFFVPAGYHTFKWSYKKDEFLSVGQDCAWTDFIVFPSPPLPQVNAGPDDTICAGQKYLLKGSSLYFDSLMWSTFGDGTFSNDTIENPLYSPGPNDIAAGSVRLRLTAYGVYGKNASSMWLTIRDEFAPHIILAPKDTLCASQKAYLSVDTTGAIAYLWMPGGYTTSQIIIDTLLTHGIGTFHFNITVWSNTGCVAMDSVTVVFKGCLGIQEKNSRFQCEIYPNPSHGKFTLEFFSSAPEKVNICLLNLRNELLFEEKNILVKGRTVKNIDSPVLPPGIYFLEIKKEDGVITKKLIIE